MSRALLVMAKRPSPGQTKTRLTPPFSEEEACKLYACFLRDSIDVARSVPGVIRFIAFTPDNELKYFERLAPDFGLLTQMGDGLGERLDNAITQCLAQGFRQVVVMDSDSPTMPAAYVALAFDSLNSADVVLGPCEDGGYYLIGMSLSQPRLLREVQMSTPSVLRDTLALAEEAGLRVALLPTWYDVDTVKDLKRLTEELGTAGDNSGVARHTRRFLDDRQLQDFPVHSPIWQDGKTIENGGDYSGPE